jgi:hypothetical protein
MPEPPEKRCLIKDKGAGMKKNNISTESTVRQIEEIVAGDIEGETVMMSVEKGRYYGLDLIGSQVWAQIEKPVKVSELIDALLLKYDVDRETCERDVLAFLEELYADGILTAVG